MGVYNDLLEECHATMPNDNMDISRLMMYAQQIVESRLNRKNRDSKRQRPYDRCTSKGNFEIHDKPEFKERFSNQIPPSVSKDRKDKVSNSRSQEGLSGSASSENPQR